MRRKVVSTARTTAGDVSATRKSTRHARLGAPRPKNACVKYTEMIGATASVCASRRFCIVHETHSAGRPAMYAG